MKVLATVESSDPLPICSKLFQRLKPPCLKEPEMSAKRTYTFTFDCPDRVGIISRTAGLGVLYE